MSEAADDDGTLEVENFFNEEILGVRTEEPKEEPFPAEAPPEPKPVEEVAVDEIPTPQEEAEDREGTEEGTKETPDSEEVAPEQEESETPEETPGSEEEAHLAWARKKYGEGIDLDSDSSKMLAKAAYEQEKLLGRQAEQQRRLEQEAQQREVEAKIAFLNTPGVLTPEEDAWIDEAVISDNPEEAADALLTEGRADLYGAFVARWVQQGDAEAFRALQHRDRVMQWATTPQPSEQESYSLALGQTFTSLGLNIEQHGPLILAKAEELGTAHPAVSGMMSPDPQMRAVATRAIFDLVTSGNVTVQKAKQDDVVAQRVQEEELRKNASGINQNGGRVEKPKQGGFWDKFDEEIEQRGWDGERPRYGTE